MHENDVPCNVLTLGSMVNTNVTHQRSTRFNIPQARWAAYRDEHHKMHWVSQLSLANSTPSSGPDELKKLCKEVETRSDNGNAHAPLQQTTIPNSWTDQIRRSSWQALPGQVHQHPHTSRCLHQHHLCFRRKERKVKGTAKAKARPNFKLRAQVVSFTTSTKS